MLRNYAYGGLALIGGAITGITISSWATPLAPPAVAPEVVRVASVAQPAMTLASTTSPAAKEASNCSPWEVSDVAMEAALNEMIRRGWRPPSQAEVVASFDTYDSSVQAIDPQAPVPVRYSSSARPSSDDTAETTTPFPVDQIQPTSESISAPQITAPVTSPPTIPVPAPAPAITVEASTPPLN